MSDSPLRILMASTSGGHLTENLILFEDMFEDDKFKCYIYTEKCNRKFNGNIAGVFNYTMGKGTYTSILGSFFKAFYIICKINPDWVVSTGAQVGLGTLLAAWILRRKTIFIETVTRFEKPTISAKILYHVASKFYVQHPEMLKCFGRKAEYIGGII